MLDIHFENYYVLRYTNIVFLIVLNSSTIYWFRRSFQTLEKAVESDPAKMMQNATESNM